MAHPQAEQIVQLESTSIDQATQLVAVPSGPVGTPPGGTMEAFSTLEELKLQNPALYNMMMQGIAMSIVGDMRGHQARLKEMMAKARRDAQQ